VDPTLLAILKCPRCGAGGSFEGSRALACKRCGLEVRSLGGGALDLLDQEERGEVQVTTTEQRFMESMVVARIYERLWRPAFVRMFAGSGAGAAVGGFAGEMFVHKHTLGLDERDGPWLDLSCATGLFVRAIAAAAPSALVVGLDISLAMLEVAGRRGRGYSNVQLVRGDAHALPFVDGSIGGINNVGALHAYDDPEQVFREVWRVLRPGGVYVGSTFAEARSLVGRLAARAAGIRRFDPDELRAWLARVGLGEFEELRLGGAFIFRARKP
jgi:SAM-dependent methyltransferase